MISLIAWLLIIPQDSREYICPLHFVKIERFEAFRIEINAANTTVAAGGEKTQYPSYLSCRRCKTHLSEKT